jgi:hypothetical protein
MYPHSVRQGDDSLWSGLVSIECGYMKNAKKEDPANKFIQAVQ